MLVGSYPFEEPEDPRNFRKTINRILNVQYSIPDYVRVSSDCRKLLSQIFVADPKERITIPEIRKHPWFLKNLSKVLIEAEKTNNENQEGGESSQSVEEVMNIIQEAKTPVAGALSVNQLGLVDDDLDADVDAEVDECLDF
ncbi:hypothetical protein J5N97_001087 [Dioscorea zingiberensis]|nr:hypothetical protein J5N97_001087 [Dioscorea zingiberensis]